MKSGIRTPSIKKSIKARTTGKLTRNVKKITSPGYGKKGMSVIKNPKKAVYNKLYNATTVSISDLTATSDASEKKKVTKAKSYKTHTDTLEINQILPVDNATGSDIELTLNPITNVAQSLTNSHDLSVEEDMISDIPVNPVIEYPVKRKLIALILCIFLGYFGAHRFYVGKTLSGVVWLVTCGVFGFGWFIDIALIISDKFTDQNNNLLA